MKFKKQNIPFTMVANEVLTRTDISLKAKGMFAYLFSKPDNWQFAAERIARDCKEDRKSILGTIKELEEAGLLDRQKLPSGRIDYHIKYSVSQSPESGLREDEPKSAFGTEAKRHGGESGRLSNKDRDSNKDKESNTVAAKAAIGSTHSQEAIKHFIMLFKGVNPTIAKLLARKTEREAADRLLGIHDHEWWAGFLAKYLVQIRVDKYCPKATTPWLMEEKLGAILSHQTAVQVSNMGLNKRGRGLEV